AKRLILPCATAKSGVQALFMRRLDAGDEIDAFNNAGALSKAAQHAVALVRFVRWRIAAKALSIELDRVGRCSCGD
ncbi:MAG: hypothetical protein AB8B71_19910, partial [Paracoccaceae bacterium]